MHQLACINIPALPLQFLLKKHPDWRPFPTVVISSKTSHAIILWANKRARLLGVSSGQSYTAALALSQTLRADTVSTAILQKELSSITKALLKFTPEIEPTSQKFDSLGLFWLNASGLKNVFPTVKFWVQNIRDSLNDNGYFCSIAVGFTRFGTYAAVKSRHGVQIFNTLESEKKTVQQVPLQCLQLPLKIQEHLWELNIQTVEEFLQLSPKALFHRFGVEAHVLHQLANDELYFPRKSPPKYFAQTKEFLEPEIDFERIIFHIGKLLTNLLQRTRAEDRSPTQLLIKFSLDNRSDRQEIIQLNDVKLSSKSLLELVRIRLNKRLFTSGIIFISIRLQTIRNNSEQFSLESSKTSRDPKTRHHCLERLRTELGTEAVVQTKITEKHLPADHFQWAPLKTSTAQHKHFTRIASRTLIRRIYSKPLELDISQWNKPHPELFFK